MCTHWSMWLEDALDVNGALADPTNKYSAIVAEDQADDLIRDKMWAFNTYLSHSMLDFQIFYIDLYLESALTGGAQQQPAAFLEEESTAEPNQFFPYMMAGGNPMAMMKIYKMYYLMFRMYSAQAAHTSVIAEHLAFEKENDDDASNDDEAENYRKFAQNMYGAFGSHMMQASYIESFTAFMELYQMYMGAY